MDKKTGLIAGAVLLFSCAAHAQTWKGFPFVASTPAFSGVAGSDWTIASLDSAAISAATGAASKLSPFRNKTLQELTDEAEPDKPYSGFKTVIVYKGAGDIKNIYRLNMPKDAHWRVLWKVEPSDEKSLFKLEIRSPSDDKYLQGLTKEMIPADRGAFGVISICLNTGGDFTLDLNVSHAGWRVEVQQLN